MFKPIITLGVIATLAACAGNTARLDMSQVKSDLSLRAAVSSAMVRTVSLPTYAAAEELAIENPEGLIASDAVVLWADDPGRAVTLSIARNLGDILSAQIGPEPWPFVGLPDAAIDVRVSRMVTGADGNFDLEGQFYVGGDGIDYPNSTSTFTITEPVRVPTPAGIADAQAHAILALSKQIARKLDR